MEIKIIEKPKIEVIGKMGQGSSGINSDWIQDLWNDANSSFNEIASLVKLNNNQEIDGFWGLMSDIDENFLPWSWQGKYLAGCEVKPDSIPPQNWTKWVLPSFKYISVKCNNKSYSETLFEVNHNYLKKHKYFLVSAIQEYYDSKDTNGELYLYFPIEVLN